MQRHQVAARPLVRSALAARSSPLSSGAVAGAVVGAVVGVFLIALCLFPFLVRARRSRHGRHGDPSLAEMGQSPGSPICAPKDLDDGSSKRFSKDHLVPGAEPGREDGADKPPNPTLPSPVSPSPSPTRVSQTAAAVPLQSPTADPSHSRYGFKGTLGRESSRELRLSDSYASPGSELTVITSAGVTEEPERFAEHGHPFRLGESLRNLLHRRPSSHRNHDSRHSTLGAAEGPRSPSLATSDIPPPGLTPSDLEIDPDTRGLAWDYYHDPDLCTEPSDAYPKSAPTPASASIAPLSIAPTSGPAAGVGVPSSITTRRAGGELDAISPGSDKAVTPAGFGRQSTFGPGRKQPSPPQRTDSLPAPTIVADIPSPPLLLYDIGPSGNPMEIMKPTNPAESAWMLEHEIRKIETSPPPPPLLLDPVPSTSIPPDAAICGMPEHDPIVKHESPYSSSDSPPYPPPSQALAEHGVQIVGEPPDHYVTSDYATPGFSTGASTAHTPGTPPSDADTTNNGQSLPLPGQSPGLSRTPSPRPSSFGPSPVTSPGQIAGPSSERSPARPPGGFVCPICGAEKNSKHQFNHHQRYHKRPFPCKHPGCELSFGTITHLNRHINDRHQKTRGYHCTQPGCAWSRQGGKSFARKDNWKRHMRNTHNLLIPSIETDEENLDLAPDIAMSGT